MFPPQQPQPRQHSQTIRLSLSSGKKWSTLFGQRLQALESQRAASARTFVPSEAETISCIYPSKASSRLRSLLSGHAITTSSSSSAPQPRGRLRVMVRDIVRQVKLSYRKVEPLANYGVHLPHQLMCCFCTRVCLSASLPCRSCSSVAHFLCLPKDFSPSPLVKDCSTFECPDCIEAYQTDVTYSLLRNAKAQEEIRYNMSTQLIARKLLTILRRKQFLRKKRMATLVQAIVRSVIARVRFIKRRLAQPRVLIVELIDIPLISIKTGLVVVTIVRSASNFQIMRMEKDAASALEEGFLIPGVDQSSILVVSFCEMKSSTTASKNIEYLILGQASTLLRDLGEAFHISCSGGNVLDLVVISDIQYMPLPVTIIEEANMRGNPKQNILELNSQSGTKEFIKTKCQLRMHVIKAPLSLSVTCNGPNLSLLSRPGSRAIPIREKERSATLKSLTNSNYDIRNSRKYWVCVFDLKCYLYCSLQDTTPRIVLNLKEADAALSAAQTAAACVTFSDTRSFVLLFAQPSDAFKFVFLCSEGKLIANGRSSYLKNLTKHRPLGFIADGATA